MPDFVSDLIPVLITGITAYVYIREQLSKLKTQLEYQREMLLQTRTDLEAHKSRMDNKLDMIIQKLDELRKDIHSPNNK